MTVRKGLTLSIRLDIITSFIIAFVYDPLTTTSNLERLHTRVSNVSLHLRGNAKNTLMRCK